MPLTAFFFSGKTSRVATRSVVSAPKLSCEKGITITALKSAAKLPSNCDEVR